MSAEPIRFFNRASGELETEAVYGEGFLRWTYENPLGKLSLEAMVKRAGFSRWYGWRMNKPTSTSKVLPFIEQYGLDPAEFADPPESFGSFNEFFYRKLNPSARPIADEEDVVVFPADGRHFAFPNISAMDSFYVKGQRFELGSFLQDPELTERYTGGTLLFSRLCPVDYHRFHFPVGGTPSELRLIQGALYSVNPLALRQRLAYLWENKRAITAIQTSRFGQVLMCPIGATCVGSIKSTYKPDALIQKGDEMGYFEFGGSSTILLFEPNTITLSEDLVEWTSKGTELYAKMGEECARASSAN